ncbi:MAG: peptide ABC transporter permease [Brevundimonas sp.]|nr:MAG: peptide ABC transporter permease [Brevundimonas sp.]
MTNIVMLNNVDHADLRVAQGHGAAYGDAVNVTRVFPNEFEPVAREYPILFKQTPDGKIDPVALLGLDRDENLFLQGDEWRARYVPMVHRRGPFSINLPGPDAPDPRDAKINVDLDHARITKAGEPVFLEHGGSTPYLEGASRTLSALYDGIRLVDPMIGAWVDAGLLESVAIDVTVGDGRRYDIDQFLAVSRDKLAALSGETLQSLHQKGWLTLAILAATSIANIDLLVRLKNTREGWA